MKTNYKKIALGVAAIAVCALGIGSTVSFLTTKTEEKINTFTFSSTAISAELLEPAWDGIKDYIEINGTKYPVYDYIDDDSDPNTPSVPVFGYKNGDSQFPVTDAAVLDDTVTADSSKTYGMDEAKGMIPGKTADKDPIVRNSCDEDEWVALKLTFVYSGTANKLSAADLAKVSDIITLDYNTEDWELITDDDGAMVYYYKNKLAPGTDTSAIFSKVSVSYSATNEQIKVLEDMGGFSLRIQGFAAQTGDGLATYDEFKASSSIVTFED